MEIIGHGGRCRIIEFQVESTYVRFRDLATPGAACFSNFDGPTAQIVFKDTQEIDHLIFILEEVKKQNSRFLGKFEMVEIRRSV